MKPTWDETFFAVCDIMAQRSDDPHTKIGAVIVDEQKRIVSTGYNGFPRFVHHKEERLSRENGLKYKYMVHAEQNAMMFAERHRMEWASIYLHFMPCSRCAQSIIQAGIRRVIIDKTRNDEYMKNNLSKYREDLDCVKKMFEEALIKIEEVDR